MKTHYCETCGAAVIQAELDRGVGSIADDKIYCYTCTAKREGKEPPESSVPAPEAEPTAPETAFSADETVDLPAAKEATPSSTSRLPWTGQADSNCP